MPETFKHIIRLVPPVAIYALIDEFGRQRWVGKTENIALRMKRHKAERPWIKAFIILEWACVADWREREQWWIKLGRESGWPLENKATGGQDGGWKQTADAKRRIGEKNKGRKKTPEAIAKWRETWRSKDRTHSLELRERRARSLRGRVVSAETRRKIGAANSGPLDPARRAKSEAESRARWANYSEAERSAISEAVSAGVKRAWARGDYLNRKGLKCRT